MKLKDCSVGSKVYMPNAPHRPAGPRYSTILYIGQSLTVLKPEFGEEVTNESSTEGFEYYPPVSVEKLRKLGDDLVLSIEFAAWNDDVGSNNLSGPTPHMCIAIHNWMEATR